MTTLDRGRMTGLQIGAVGICLVLNLIDGFDVLAMAFAAPMLANDWNLAPEALGVLFSAGLFGMTAGSLLLAPLADRWGRRAMTLLTLALVSVGMVASAFTNSPAELVTARALTGVGIGAMLPSINTICAEYSSAKRRELALSIMATGYPIGATLGGTAAIFVSAAFGWRGIFVLGGLVSTAMLPLVAWRLPESLDFLLTRRPAGALDSANGLLRRLGRPPLDALPALEGAVARKGLRDVVAGGLMRPTLLLWTTFFAVMFTFYFVLSWTPKLLVDAGLPTGQGLSGGVLVNLGGIAGTVLLGVLSAKLGIFRLHTLALIGSTFAVAWFGLSAGSLQVALVAAVCVGFFLFVSMVGLYVILPSVYPTEVRNTGTGLAIGVGRFGGILSPYLAGMLLSSGWKPAEAYVLFGVPTLVASFAIVLLARNRRAASRPSGGELSHLEPALAADEGVGSA